MITAEKAKENVLKFKEDKNIEKNGLIKEFLSSISPIVEEASASGYSYTQVTCTISARNEVIEELIKLGYEAFAIGVISIGIKW